MDGRNAEQDATEVLKTYWSLDNIPVDPIAIAQQMGVKVYYAHLDEGISGVLEKDASGDAEIYLNDTDSYNGQRFTCAHELGHFVKRSAAGEEAWQFVDLRSPLTSTGTDATEVCANQFAAELLMPSRAVRSLRDNWGPAGGTRSATTRSVQGLASGFPKAGGLGPSEASIMCRRPVPRTDALRIQRSCQPARPGAAQNATRSGVARPLRPRTYSLA